MRLHGIHVGLYFSHLDWLHVDYLSVWNTEAVKNGWQYDFDAPAARYYLPADQLHEERWEKFLTFSPQLPTRALREL